MKTTNFLTSACRHCRYYQLEGRRGGMCQMLGGTVHGNWKACALAIPTFASTWKDLEAIMILSDTSSVVTPTLVPAKEISQLQSSELKAGSLMV